jgi:hypothetical protein
MTPRLQAVIAEGYNVFARYTLAGPLTVCHCDCCMREENEGALRATPLKEIPADLLAEYTNSAHAWDDDVVARELRYFLPRYLELIAQNDPPDHLGLDICLRRLAYAHWRAKWPGPEVDVLDCFFDALLVASLPRLELSEWPAGWRLDFDLADVLTLVVTADGDIKRMLAAWDGSPDPPAAIHMAALRGNVLRRSHRTFFYSAYLPDHPEAADAIGAFLVRPEVTARIEAAVFTVEDPRLQQILSDALG